MGKLNPEAKAKLLEAIKTAERPGGCTYAYSNEYHPGVVQRCVVGQFAHLCGVPDTVLKKWDEYADEMIGSGWSSLPEDEEGVPDLNYRVPRALLIDIQFIWDTASAANADLRRERMRDVVERYDRESLNAP